jgi:archaemetzincin
MKPLVDLPKRKIVALLSSGTVSPLTMEVLAGHIQGLLSLPAEILGPFAPPDGAFHQPRNQYNAAVLLQFLAGPPGSQVTETDAYPARSEYLRVMGVTSFDLFLPIFTHVYGEAQISGRAAVISLFRLRTGADGAAVGQELFLTRSAKVAIHELLHTFGLVHCRHAHCLMRPVTKITDLDELPLTLCRSCAQYWEDCRKKALLD